MKIVCLPVTMIQENVYFYYDEATNEGIVVDPGGEAERLCEFITSNELKIKGILLTHGHFDHIQAVAKVKELTGAPVVAHTAEGVMLRDPKQNMSVAIRQKIEVSADMLLNDGDEFEFGGNSLRVIHTPGHTPGGVSYYSEENAVLFSGDTLFYDSVGRSDLVGGNDVQLLASIREKLYTLPDDTTVYPGHGQATTIGHEKNHNPFTRA